MYDSLQPHGLQPTRLPCLSLTPGVYSNSCPLNQCCHPTTSSSAIPFSSRLQSFPASGCFPMSQFFASGGQSIGVSASASVHPFNIQDWFPLGHISRWRSRRTCAHFLLQELQNYNSLLKSHWQETVGSHQKHIPHIQEPRRSPSKTVGGVKLHLESNPIGNKLYFNLNKFFFF